MIIIADSGGSKIDWRLIENSGAIEQASAPGFNPYYQPIEDLSRNVKDVLLPKIKEKVDKIFFYGAGVSSEKNQETIKRAFLEFFPGAHIEIGWDYLPQLGRCVGTSPVLPALWERGQIHAFTTAKK